MPLRKRTVWMAALVLAIAGIAAVATHHDAQPPRTEAARSEQREIPGSNEPTPPPTESTIAQVEPAPQVKPAKLDRVRERSERDALRARIASAQRKATATRPPEQKHAPAAKPAEADDPDRPGHLIDRVGGRGELVAHMNRDFMPLARDCIRQAQERSPELRGMLTLQLETVSDEELGAVIDRADVPTTSEVQERELTECMRENALTVIFPKSIATGQERFELTLRVEPDNP